MALGFFDYTPKMEKELTGTRVPKAGFIATACQLEYFKHVLIRTLWAHSTFPQFFKQLFWGKIALVMDGKTKVLKEI